MGRAAQVQRGPPGRLGGGRGDVLVGRAAPLRLAAGPAALRSVALAALAGPARQLRDPLDHELLVADAQHARQLDRRLVLDRDVLDVGDDGRGLVQGGRPARRVLQVVPGDDVPQRELEQRRTGLHQAGHGRVALGQAQVAGVHAAGGDGDRGLRGELLVVLEGPQGGLLARRVAVEGEDHLGSGVVHQQPAQDLDVVPAEGGAAGRDRGGDPGHVAGHHVRVALDDHGPGGLRDLLLRQVDAVQHLGLLVDRGLGGVQVLRAVVVVAQLARAEADHLAADVADRPHQPAAEAVDRFAAAAVLGEPGGDQLLVAEALAAQEAGQVVPPGRAVAHAEVRGRGLVEAALRQELAADLRLGAAQLVNVELGGGLVRLDQPDAVAAAAGAGGVAALLVPQGDAGQAGQALDRLREGEVVDLHDEVEGVPARLAAEAVVEPLAGADLEGRGLLVVEGAQALEVAAARVAQLEVLGDHGVDRDRVPYRLHVVVVDPSCHP